MWLFFVSELFGISISFKAENIIQIDSTNSAYRLLADSTLTLLYGQNCGLEGQDQPDGRLAIQTLIDEKQFPLIRELLNGHSNEGRVYAIEALLELNREGTINLTSFEKKQIKNIIKTDFKVFRCLGCEYETIKSSELFQEQILQDLLYSNGIKITIANTK
jgi:hypothetical protein